MICTSLAMDAKYQKQSNRKAKPAGTCRPGLIPWVVRKERWCLMSWCIRIYGGAQFVDSVERILSEMVPLQTDAPALIKAQVTESLRQSRLLDRCSVNLAMPGVVEVYEHQRQAKVYFDVDGVVCRD